MECIKWNNVILIYNDNNNSKMIFGVCALPKTGQEANKGPVWCPRPPPELLQVHGAGVQRNVPALLHQAAALQSHQVLAAVQIEGRPFTALRNIFPALHTPIKSLDVTLSPPSASSHAKVNFNAYNHSMRENQLSIYGHMMPFLTFDPF